MFGVIVCIVSLGLANFVFEAFREVPNYVDAAYNQLTAVLIYFFWSKD